MENLLDKFIRNEKKAKLWALISLVAFTAIGFTVVYVAKEVAGKGQHTKNGTDDVKINKRDTIFKTDTFLLAANDSKLNRKIIKLRDSLIKIQREKEKLGDKLEENYKECIANNEILQGAIQELKNNNKECNDKYINTNNDLEKLKIQLAECIKKKGTSTGGGSSGIKPINVVINYNSQIPDTTVDKLEKLLSRSKIKMSVSRVKMKQGVKPVIMYFSADDIKVADYISTLINNPSYFRSALKYSSYLNTNMSKTAGNIEIWLSTIY